MCVRGYVIQEKPATPQYAHVAATLIHALERLLTANQAVIAVLLARAVVLLLVAVEGYVIHIAASL
jgi:hypothetical protein